MARTISLNMALHVLRDGGKIVQDTATVLRGKQYTLAVVTRLHSASGFDWGVVSDKDFQELLRGFGVMKNASSEWVLPNQ